LNKFVIVGSGAAGLSAAEAIRKQEPKASIQIITEDPYGYYSRPGLAYFLAKEVPVEALYPYNERYYRNLDLHFIKERVTRIKPAEHILNLAGGRIVPYDRLLVAIGATATRPDTPGINLEGVVTLDSMEDTLHIMKLARHSSSAVVIGGGITALELVEGFAISGLRTHYFLRGDRYWSGVLDETESHLVEERLKEDRVILHFNTRAAEILGKKNKVEGVRTDDGQVTPCQIVGIAIGIRPNKELAQVSGLAVKRGILVNDHQMTSDPDVFAAGDVAQVIDPDHPDGLLESLWNPALLQGTVAGLNMAGINSPLCRPTAVNVTRLAGLVTTIIGQVGDGDTKGKNDRDTSSIMRGDSEEWREIPNAVVAQTEGNHSRLRLYIGERAIAGAMVMGDQTLSRPLQELIERQVNIRELRPRLLEPGARINEMILNYWKSIPQLRHPANLYASKVA
jgi:NAD(P)H-nitrite reductase large subunit